MAVTVAGCPVLYCTCVVPAYLASGTHAHVDDELEAAVAVSDEVVCVTNYWRL